MIQQVNKIMSAWAAVTSTERWFLSRSKNSGCDFGRGDEFTVSLDCPSVASLCFWYIVDILSWRCLERRANRLVCWIWSVDDFMAMDLDKKGGGMLFAQQSCPRSGWTLRWLRICGIFIFFYLLEWITSAMKLVSKPEGKVTGQTLREWWWWWWWIMMKEHDN